MRTIAASSTWVILRHTVAVLSGQITIEDDHLVPIEIELVHRVQAVVGDTDSQALVAQALRDVIGQAPPIFDDEHSHREPQVRIIANGVLSS